MRPVTARQVHLDFHTSEHIPGVGSRFSKAQFQEALRLGRVDWINIFAKCHHGWSYYPTEVGAVHPTLTIDLLGQQIEACHEMGVRAPIYYTVGWSVHDAETHPEWCVRKPDGTINATNWDPNAGPDDPKPNFSWQFMCPSGGYLDLMLRQTEEICQRFAVDGLWYDITAGPPCWCETCRTGMLAEGIGLADEDAVQLYNVGKWRRFSELTSAIVARYHPEASVFYNGTTVIHGNGPHGRDPKHRLFDANTNQELEDLPTTWGGYDKLPLRARFFQNTGKPLIAMSGKFHTSWGEFGGFKHPDALRYEAGSMLAYGAACNFGDQLHPAGAMDLGTYRNIGAAFEYVEQIEAYGLDAVPAADLGLWFSGSQTDDEGTALMLLETQHDFAVVDPAADFARYRVIVLPGAACLSAAEAAKLAKYVAGGGNLLVTGESALDQAGTRFVLDVGADYLGSAQYADDFTVVEAGSVLSEDLVSSPFLNYTAALRMEPRPGTEVLAALREPYFNRTYGHYCSHQNTPNQLAPAAHPAAIRRGNVVFLAHRLGRLYYQHGARIHRQLFANALRLLYPEPVVETTLPSAGRASLMHQPQHRRYVAHLLYAPPLQRGRCLVIEDTPPLYDVPLAVHVPETITAARLVPGDAPLPLTHHDGAASVTVPRVQGHQAVVLEY
jgi:hypothetical protein